MTLTNFDDIQVVNLTNPLPTDSYEQVCEPAVDLGHRRGDYDEDDQPLPSLEKVLRDVEETQHLQYTGASLAIGERPTDGAFNILTSSDYVAVPLLGPPRDGDTSADADIRNSDHPPRASDARAESSDGAIKNVESGSSAEGKEEADIDDGHNRNRHQRGGDRTDMGAPGIWESSKRTAGNAGLYKGPEDIPRPEKIRRTGLSAAPKYSIPSLMPLRKTPSTRQMIPIATQACIQTTSTSARLPAKWILNKLMSISWDW